MIKQWFSKKQPATAHKQQEQKQQSKNKPKPVGKKSAAQTAKSAGNKNTKKPQTKARPKPAKKTWDIKNFDVPAVEGKTRFHDLNLHVDLMQSIHEASYEYCSPIQALTLPHTLKGLDMIGKAQTGTGKTAAFLITVIDQILSNPIEDRYHSEPRALIIAPTRELVAQIAQDAKNLGRAGGLHIVTLVGGEPHEKQRKELDADYVDILVATPGRLIDFVMQKAVYLDQVETLVLDEADRMLDMGFIPQVKQIVRATPNKESRQTLLFSATFSPDIINLSRQWTLDPASVEIEPESVATDTVEQIAYMVSDSEKIPFLLEFLTSKSLGQTIIFANRRDQTQRLFDRLRKGGIKVGILSGEIAQNKRTKTLSDFKNGTIQFLIATDVVGRGIHIDGISHVINYNLPQEPENYVHRIGRTGRAGASGIAISLIGEEDAFEMQGLETLLGKKLNMTLPPESFD